MNTPGGVVGLARPLLAFSLVVSAALVVGCSKPREARKPTFPVRGQVFVQDKPAAKAFLLFVPVNEPADSKDPRPRAEAGPDGTFQVTTYDADDGAPSGEYIVTVTWPGGVLPDGREEPEDKLLGRYANPAQSRLRATVKESPNELPPFRLK